MNRFRPVFARLAALALLAAPFAAAHADSVPFASFSDNSSGAWHYTGGASSATLTATGDLGYFVSFGGPNQILNYLGSVTYDVNAFSSGNAIFNGQFIQQEIDGEITFYSGSTLVLDVLFQGALFSGKPNSNSTGLAADTQISGNIISYSTSPSIQVAPFTGPFSFSIALTQTPGLSINGNNLTDFIATASGSFSSTVESTGHNPTPLPAPAPTGLALLTTLFGARYFLARQRKTVRIAIPQQ